MSDKRKEKSPPMSRRSRIISIVLLVGVLLIIAGIWTFRIPENYVHLFLNHYDGSTAVLSEMKGIERSETELASLLPLQQDFDDWEQTHLRDEVSVTAGDGTVLRGGFYDAGSDVTVILLHTFDGSSEDSDYLFAPYYAARGCNLLLPDSRAHGESEGDRVTYGLLEGGDVAAWCEWLLERCGAQQQIILHGATLGANAALAGAALTEQNLALAGHIRFIVGESPVVNLYDAADYLLDNQFHLPGAMVWLADQFAKGALDGQSMKTVDLAAMTEGCTVPLLVLQGSGDTIVDPAATAAFCDGYAGDCQLLTANCAHGMVYATDPEGCEAALDVLMRQYIG